VARADDDVIRQLEQAAQARMQQARLTPRVARDVQIRAADVADQQRVAAEQEPGIVPAAPPVGDGVRVMGLGMTRGRDGGHHGVAERHDLTVGERGVSELHAAAVGEVPGRAGLDQRREP